MIKKLCPLILTVILCVLTVMPEVAVADNGLIRGEFRYFKDGKIFSEDTVNPGDVITAKISVMNEGTALRDAALITALYTSDGKMEAVDYTGQILDSGERAVLEAVVIAPQQEDIVTAYNIKSYLWNGLTTMVPCTQIDASLSEIPTGLKVTDVTTSTIELSWDEVSTVCGSSVLGYNIYRNGVNVYSTVGTAYKDAGLLDNEKYTYTVKAFGMNGEGLASDAITSSTVNILRIDMTGDNVENGKIGTDGLNIYKCDGTNITAFDTDDYDTLYSEKSGIYSIGNYFNRLCYVGYKTTNNQCGIMFDIDDSFIGNNSELVGSESGKATFLVEYFDNSCEPVYFTYRSGTEEQSKTITPIQREDSRTWKTCVFTVDDAEFESSSDWHFCFAPRESTATTVAPIYVSEIGVAKNYVPMGAVLDADDSTGEAGLLSYEYLDIIGNDEKSPIECGIETVKDDITLTPAFCLKPADEESGKVPRLCVGVDESYITPLDNNVKIRITYWDFVNDARDSYIRIDYTGLSDDGSVGINTITPIKLTGTKTWKTAEFVIHNAYFNTDDLILDKPTQDYVQSDTGEALYISKIEVIKLT